VSGKVINIARGSNGGGGLSTIAIYNAQYNATVIYLHSAPLSGLSVGQSISRGQQIATEAWRGISSSGASHTHVEMRPGRHTNASKSVNDPVLDNPNPTSFWNARGYNVR
jgi:murein DD-endopeptidase MepM/ murein hydrolase activator NlpD